MAKSRTSRAAAGELAELHAAVERLSDTVQVLIEAVDQLTEEVQWRNNQLRDRCPRLPPVVVSSLPLDPTTKDWQINPTKPEDLPDETPSPVAGPPPIDPVPLARKEARVPSVSPLNVRDLSTLERSANWLDELIHACRKGGPLHARNPTLVADITRKAQALHTSLTTLRQFLDQPQEETHAR